jgi:hypothetical protein
MALSKAAARERARIASLTRSRTPDDPELLDARQKLIAIRLTDYVHKVAPMLTPEQREPIAAMLRDESRWGAA